MMKSSLPQGMTRARRRFPPGRGYLACLLLFSYLFFPAADLFAQPSRLVPVPELEWRALAGDARAAGLLGQAYLQGIGVRPNQELARKWYLFAAERGNAVAQYELAKLCDMGTGGPTLPNDALRWAQTAFDSGIGQAGELLAIYHLQGRAGLKPDLRLGSDFLRAAMRQGGLAAPVLLGALMENGLDGSRNRERALELYLEAGRRGNPLGWVAAASLSEETGRFLAAAVFYRLALERPLNLDEWGKEIKLRISRLRKKLTPAQLAESSVRLTFWKGIQTFLPSCGPVETPLLRYLSRCGSGQ